MLQHGEAEIVRECDPLGVRVTRYGDDYAISAASREGVVAIRNMIIRDLQALGLPLNRRKSSTMPNHRAQVVHGLTVNGGCASLPKRKRAAPGRLSREALRDEVRRACRDGATDEQQRRLEGQLAHLARRHPQQAEKLRRLLGQTRADHP